MVKDKLIKYDQKKLTDWQIIYKQHKRLKLIINFLLILISSVLVVWPIYKFELIHCITIPVGVLIGWLTIRSVRRETLEVLKAKYNKKYSLGIKEKWDYQEITDLRFKMLKEYLKEQKVKLDSDRIKFLINSMYAENNSNKYSYISINISISITIGFIGAFLGASFALAKDMAELLEVSRIFLAILFWFSILIIYGEMLIVKPLIMKRRNKYSRLIKALEAMYLE